MPLNVPGYEQRLSLNINEHSNELDLRLAKEVAPYFGVSVAQADTMIDTILRVVSRWRILATQAHISHDEQERMASAFMTEM